MKKLLWFLVLIFLALTATYFVLTRKKEVTAYIPENASSVFVADYVNIRNHFIWEKIKNPSSWFKKDTGSFSFEKYGLKTPDYLVGYSMQEFPECLFAIIELDDLAPLGLDVSTTETDGFIKLHRLACAYLSNDNKQVGFVIGKEYFDRNTAREHFDLAFEKENNLKNGVRTQIKSNSNHFFGSSKLEVGGPFYINGNLSTSFDKGLEFSWDFQQNGITDQDLNKYIRTDADSLVYMSDGYGRMSINGFAKQMDTAITYTYDDDFNKIEQKEIKEVTVPHVSIHMPGAKLFAYLKRKGLIEQKGNSSYLTALPIEGIVVKDSNNGFYSSNEGYSETIKPEFARLKLNLKGFKGSGLENDLTPALLEFPYSFEFNFTKRQVNAEL